MECDGQGRNARRVQRAFEASRERQNGGTRFLVLRWRCASATIAASMRHPPPARAPQMARNLAKVIWGIFSDSTREALMPPCIFTSLVAAAAAPWTRCAFPPIGVL